MLTAIRPEIIAFHTINGPGERYPEVPVYAFRGQHAFDLHSRLVRLVDRWDGLFTDAQKKACMLMITVQTTVPKAALRNPDVMPKNPRRRIKLYLYSKEPTVSSAVPYSSANGKTWLKLLAEEPHNLL